MKLNSAQTVRGLLLGIVVASSFGLGGCTSGGGENAANGAGDAAPNRSTEKQTIAFVTNNASDFWTIARKGTEKAAGELPNFQVEFKMPPDGQAATQKQILEDLVSNGTKGIAVSPVDPTNQVEDLNKIAEKTALICQDSDAPDSNRLCYLGTDNVAAGRMAGEELKKALPNGGKVMVFVGKADAQNAKERFEGLKEAIKGTKIEILDLRTDDTDPARAKQNVADALVNTPDLAGCVGLWSYNGPAILNAVKEAKKEGKVQIVAFDEDADTLAGVKDGIIFSTIVQQPFEFGYQATKLLAKIIEGDKSAIPADKKIIVPTQAIGKDNVEEFSKKLAELKK